MLKITKIDVIRNELARIASAEDRLDPIAPTMKASWSFTRVMVIGKIKSQAIGYDLLQVILKGIATGSGEANFWQTIESTNFDELAEKLKRELEVNQLKDHQQPKKTLA